jgi:hypothetical protein
MSDSLERLFDEGKHLFGAGVVVMQMGIDTATDRHDGKKTGEQSQNDWIKPTPWGIVKRVPTEAEAEVRYGAVDGRAAHARRD